MSASTASQHASPLTHSYLRARLPSVLVSTPNTTQRHTCFPWAPPAAGHHCSTTCSSQPEAGAWSNGPGPAGPACSVCAPTEAASRLAGHTLLQLLPQCHWAPSAACTCSLPELAACPLRPPCTALRWSVPPHLSLSSCALASPGAPRSAARRGAARAGTYTACETHEVWL